MARFPFPPHGRIPNFDGADRAAERLAELPPWRRADILKCNPDAPQRPVRRRALEDGKTVYMAVPRLRDERCFFRLDPAELAGRFEEAATIKGASKLATQVRPDAMERIDLVVAGSVAVDEDGGRVGKGGGYSDLEFAVARTLGLVDDTTPVVTTVHGLQIVETPLPMEAHDVPLDYVVIHDRTVKVPEPRKKPTGILWEEIGKKKREEIPVLRRLAQDG